MSSSRLLVFKLNLTSGHNMLSRGCLFTWLRAAFSLSCILTSMVMMEMVRVSTMKPHTIRATEMGLLLTTCLQFMSLCSSSPPNMHIGPHTRPTRPDRKMPHTPTIVRVTAIHPKQAFKAIFGCVLVTIGIQREI